MSHPIKLIANALGVPPDYMIEAGKERGIPVAALVGAKEHAVKQVAAGVDLIVAQGTEAGGHCGEVTTMVLIPEVVEAIEAAVPVLAAGGIVTGRQMAGAVAMGADGAWTGSVWLTTEEAETAPHTVQKILGGDVPRHHPVGGANGKACAAIGLGLDECVAAERRRPPAVAATAAVDAVRARDPPGGCACLARASGRAGVGDLLRRPGCRADEQGQARPRGGARVHRGLSGGNGAAQQLAAGLT